jgi:hypothetical protein
MDQEEGLSSFEEPSGLTSKFLNTKNKIVDIFFIKVGLLSSLLFYD